MKKKDIQVLITTVKMENTISLLEKMNIKTDFIIGNQTDFNNDSNINFKGNNGMIISRKAVGVGRNRNELLNHASAKICILADDDMVFYDNYSEIVIDAFSNCSADILIFNLDSEEKENYYGERVNKKRKRVGYLNYMNYGAARIAFRTSAVSYAGVFFNVNFGGGTKHQCGEDSLFLNACIRARLVIETVPISIAKIIKNRESTWFHGYTRKYFFDKGVFLGLAHPYLANLFVIYLVLRHKEYLKNGLSKKTVKKEIKKGIKFIRRKKIEN